jgi:hypothetical protein
MAKSKQSIVLTRREALLLSTTAGLGAALDDAGHTKQPPMNRNNGANGGLFRPISSDGTFRLSPQPSFFLTTVFGARKSLVIPSSNVVPHLRSFNGWA